MGGWVQSSTVLPLLARKTQAQHFRLSVLALHISSPLSAAVDKVWMLWDGSEGAEDGILLRVCETRPSREK